MLSTPVLFCHGMYFHSPLPPICQSPVQPPTINSSNCLVSTSIVCPHSILDISTPMALFSLFLLFSPTPALCILIYFGQVQIGLAHMKCIRHSSHFLSLYTLSIYFIYFTTYTQIYLNSPILNNAYFIFTNSIHIYYHIFNPHLYFLITSNDIWAAMKLLGTDD